MTVDVSFKDHSGHLGDFAILRAPFEGVQRACEEFLDKKFLSLSGKRKSDRVNEILLSLILKSPEPSFLLTPILDFFDRIKEFNILENYSFSGFELWLNQFSGLSAQDNYRVRGRIAGKWVPREEYQILFPIGMNKIYPGSHYVTAHGSPDLDTTVASFWGWIDAFAARVSEGVHLWNVPGGVPLSQVEIGFLFIDVFGEGVFSHVIKERTTLSLSSFDLMTQKGFAQWEIDKTAAPLDHTRHHEAVILVDHAGFYLGDWRDFDVESVRQVTMLVASCLRWLQTNFHLRLVTLFAKPHLTKKEVEEFSRFSLALKLADCEPAKEFSQKQKQHVHDYLTHVLRVNTGLESTLEQFAASMKLLGMKEFEDFIEVISSFAQSSLFNSQGNLVENRPLLFNSIEKVIESLDRAIVSVRHYVDRLAVGLDIKKQVFGYLPQIINFRADVDEIKNKMGQYPYLTVVEVSSMNGKIVPMGVVHANDLHKPILGTVTLRDFCNREETKIPSYLEVISVIDHHKCSLQTNAPSMMILSDAQSSNVIVAEMAFSINDRYSLNGMTTLAIAEQIREVQKDLSGSAQKRILQRLLQRQIVIERESFYYIDSNREFIEYLHFLYAILDDTDLLTKVSARDLNCVASLLNRLKSLMLGKEVEIVHFDDLIMEEDFLARACARILQNPDLYSLCRKIYSAKENGVTESIRLSAEEKSLSFFLDTKEQNGCCRVGQTKLFARNFPTYQKYAARLRKIWYEEAAHIYKENREIDLHLHMVSTIPGAEDIFAGSGVKHIHKDELWIWIPETESGVAHLNNFLDGFRSSSAIIGNDREHQLEVEFLGENTKQLEAIFKGSFVRIPKSSGKSQGEMLPIAVLRFKAGTINSRKASISPFLPRLLT